MRAAGAPSFFAMKTFSLPRNSLREHHREYKSALVWEEEDIRPFVSVGERHGRFVRRYYYRIWYYPVNPADDLVCSCWIAEPALKN